MLVLQNDVEKQEERVSATITAQKAGIRRIWAILVVILVIVAAAFSGALVEIATLEERLGLMSADVSAEVTAAISRMFCVKELLNGR